MPRRCISFGALLCFCSVAVPAALAHRLEPISTHFARPFERGIGSIEITYEYEHRNREDASRHLIPEVEFELGISRRMQFSLEAPLILERSADEPARVGGGNLEIAARYLLAGGSRRNYAISLNGFVAPPAGDNHLAGDATEVGAALHFDKEITRRVYFHGNYGWSTTIGGTQERERTFFYRSAFVFPVSYRWNPGVELLGETDTATGHTELVVQPEMIFFGNARWELKAGVPIGLTRSSPNIGVRAQVTWIFGRSHKD